MSSSEEKEQARGKRRTTLMSIGVAALLVAMKLGVGLATGSLGLISAGIESSGDVIAAVITFFAVRLGGRPADHDHPYGHRRAENLGAIGEAAILLAGGVLVSVQAISHLIDGGHTPQIRWYQFAVIGLAVVLDLSRVRVSLIASRRYGSPALRSNAFHFAGDMAGSVAVLVGLLAVNAGFAEGDSVAALVVAAIIFTAALRLIAENGNVLMDRAPEDARIAAEQAIAELGEDIELSRLRLRESAGRYFADVVVSFPAGHALVEGHRAADLVEAAVERALPGSDVVVHVEPRRRGLDLRDRVLAIALSEPLVKEAHDITIFEHGGLSSVSLHLKFPADLDLREAHEIGERVEQEIRARPGVAEVQTHLEPLELPLIAKAPSEQADIEAGETIERLVLERTGRKPVMVKLLATDVGRVVFLTVHEDGARSLSEAHELAGELEEELRLQLEDIADVVVHTEP
jgi:cation diffusion facilitator family transporter